MRKFAVSYIDWFDHDLTTIIVRAPDWQHALQMHSKVKEFDIDWNASLDDVKKQFFDCDATVECVEIEA